ncbi:hypothetical protein H3C70_02830 [Patescibacteria group bacterium]|nr:hypothetical protein [Patescibacteria group bacterium]
MKLRFFFEHQNSKLFQLYLLQALLIISVFTLFFYSVGFAFYYALLAGTGAFLAIACLFRWMNLPFYILPKISGAVYVPTTAEQLEVMVKLAKVKPGERSVDLGSGDGRVVEAFAQAGAVADGLEINPGLVEQSEEYLAENKVKGTKIVWQSFWDADLSDYDIITVYGYPSIMKGLGKKLRAELKPGARVISNQFPFPRWQADQEEDSVYLYIQK